MDYLLVVAAAGAQPAEVQPSKRLTLAQQAAAKN